MSRPLRVQYPGAIYHVISRGNGGNNIFEDKRDYLTFLEELGEVIKDYNWISYTYCLMPNHYHLLIKTLDPNLSSGMRQLNGKYTQRHNIRYKKFGHVFQGRFKSILVEDSGYHGQLIRYINLNPVKAKMVRSVADWPWSGHGEILGLSGKTGCVDADKTLACFHRDREQAKEEYKKYLSERIEDDNIWTDLHSGVILGSLKFAREIMDKYKDKGTRENTKRERFAGRPALEEIFKDIYNREEKNRLIIRSFQEYGYAQTEIGDFLDLHYSTVSKIIKNSKFKT